MARPANSIRWWLVAIVLVFVGTGMAYSLLWADVVRHDTHYWLNPGDFWSTWRNAHWVGWGGLSYVYTAGTGLVTLPGFAVVLSPFAALASALHLTESSPFVSLPKPEAWLLAGPVIMASVAIALAGADALARHLEVSPGRRRLLALGVAGTSWPAIVWWGHPEDVVALGIAAYALTRLLQRRFTATGWLLGLAIAMQLYVIVLVPVFMAVVGRRRVAPLLARAAIAPGFLFVAVVVPAPRETLHALWNQPNFPTVDHPTPWASLSPSLGHHVIAAGPARVIALALAAAIGVVAIRFRERGMAVLWLCCASLAARTVFEAVMVPYYVMPVVALALVGAAAAGWRRLGVAMAAGGFVTVDVFWHYGPWPYWVVMTAAVLVLLAAALPARSPVQTVQPTPAPPPVREADLLDRPLPHLDEVLGGYVPPGVSGSSADEVLHLRR
ncbi:MAG TPA: hypothetical protein VE991_05020 [Acidimicrobiales bacterium]|nr:hypothetical protein [Acidimicrobiales bacterium]